MVKAKTLTQNTFFYTMALVFQKLLAFIYFTFLARELGAEDLGKYVFAFSFTTIFSVFVDVGQTSVLTREIAKDKEKTEKLLGNILGTKIPLAVLTYVTIIILINILNYPEIVKYMVYLTGIVMLLDNFASTFWGVLRGNQNLKFESTGLFIFQLIAVGVGGTLLFFKAGLIYLVMAILLASLFNMVLAYTQMRVKLKIKPKIKFDKELTKKILKISIPFALTGIFARLNTQIDTIFLSKMGCLNNAICEANVGIYSVASKITLAVHFIPLAFVAALFPALSKYFAEDKEKLAKTFEKAMRYLMVIGIPLSAGIMAIGPAFVPQVFGVEYTESILPLNILMISLSFIFLTFPIGSLLNAGSKQLRNSINIGIAVVVNIVLNLILIPQITYTGAAISSLVSTLVILILGLSVVPQVMNYDKKNLIVSFVKSILAAGIMFVVLRLLLEQVYFVILIPIGIVIYFGILIMIGGFSKDDMNNLLASMRLKKRP
jgi:O-antigen/teichoic acid export membrane protein